MRVVRVNELVKRELSAILHTRYQAQTVRITISEVEVAPNLRSAVVYYNVIGGEEDRVAARHFFSREHGELRNQLGRVVVLKYLPHLKFHFDDSLARGSRMNTLIDELGLDGETDADALPPDELD